MLDCAERKKWCPPRSSASICRCRSNTAKMLDEKGKIWGRTRFQTKRNAHNGTVFIATQPTVPFATGKQPSSAHTPQRRDIDDLDWRVTMLTRFKEKITLRSRMKTDIAQLSDNPSEYGMPFHNDAHAYIQQTNPIRGEDRESLLCRFCFFLCAALLQLFSLLLPHKSHFVWVI